MDAFEPFVRLRLGTCRYPETLAMILRERGYKHTLLNRIRTGDIVNLQEEIEVDLVACTNHQLGMETSGWYHQARAAGLALGLKLCPRETFLQLLLQHEHSILSLCERHGRITVSVMSDPISDHRNSYVMQFRVYEGRVLIEPRSLRYGKQYTWQGPFVFMKPCA
jgi:hypothetical protein